MYVKKLIILIVLCFICVHFISAQNHFPPDGNVGIGTGTSQPDASLRIVGPSSSFGMGPHFLTAPGRFSVSGESAEISFIDRNATGWVNYPSNGERWVAYAMFNQFRIWSGSDKLVVTHEGRVGIGTTTPNEKLTVDGTIWSTKMKVTQAVWPDYVFSPYYKLPALKDVESYINQNRHLQGIPSSQQVEKEGLDVGGNQAALLQKIEELTLYVIDQDKRLEEQSKRLAEQQRQIQELGKEVRARRKSSHW